jgi:hypothetical protein
LLIIRPELVVPVFLWTVIFDYVAVPNDSIYYAYDFAELTFFAILAWLGTTTNRAHLFLPVLILFASFNKETALFMIPVFVVYAACAGTTNRWSILSAAISVAAVLIAKYIAYYYVIKMINPDVSLDPHVYENKILDNLKQLLNPLAWFAWAGVFGGGTVFLAMPGASVRLLNFAIAVIIIGWLAILFVVGLPREMRLFGPMAFLVILPLMLKIETFLYPETTCSRDNRLET